MAAAPGVPKQSQIQGLSQSNFALLCLRWNCWFLQAGPLAQSTNLQKVAVMSQLTPPLQKKHLKEIMMLRMKVEQE